MRTILLNALVTAVCCAIVGGLAYWAAVQWIELYSPNYSTSTIVTEDTYIIFIP